MHVTGQPRPDPRASGGKWQQRTHTSQRRRMGTSKRSTDRAVCTRVELVLSAAARASPLASPMKQAARSHRQHMPAGTGHKKLKKLQGLTVDRLQV
eukprot:4225443-Pleurochrysis_carterae.AAC.8